MRGEGQKPDGVKHVTRNRCAASAQAKLRKKIRKRYRRVDSQSYMLIEGVQVFYLPLNYDPSGTTV